MGTKYHKNKELHDAIGMAVALGWRWVRKTNKNHLQGELYCPHANRSGCIVRVNSTPRRPEVHAKHVLTAVTRCPHLTQRPLDLGSTLGEGRFVKPRPTGEA